MEVIHIMQKSGDCIPLILGIDVGSTTVKAVVVDSRSQQIVWSDYQRHETRQAEKTLELLRVVETTFGDRCRGMRAFVTGSGAKPLTAPLGAGFVQEVNAVTMAVEKLHPEGDCATLGNMRYFGKKSACLDLRLLNRHEDAAYGENR